MPLFGNYQQILVIQVPLVLPYCLCAVTLKMILLKVKPCLFYDLHEEESPQLNQLTVKMNRYETHS